MANYDSAVAQIYALGHELSQTPAHKFDLERAIAPKPAAAHRPL